MSTVISFILLGLGLYNLVREIKENSKNDQQNKQIREFKKDFQGVPIEVQRAISEVKNPSKASKESTAFGVAQKDKEVPQTTETVKEDSAMEMAPIEYKKLGEKPMEEQNPFDFIDDYDRVVRPFVYREILSEPKCKRK